MSKHIAIVPARSGSTRLKDKNFSKIGDLTLVEWCIYKLVGTNLFDKVIISTDSDKLDALPKNAKIMVKKRQANLADNKTPVLKTILSLAEQFEFAETISYFLPTCPFIGLKSIREGFNHLLNNQDTNSVSVAEYSEIPQLACKLTNHKELIPIFDNLSLGMTNSNYLPKFCRPTGGFYMGYRSNILKNKSYFNGSKTAGIMTSQLEAHDINTKFDLLHAQSLYQNEKKLLDLHCNLVSLKKNHLS